MLILGALLVCVVVALAATAVELARLRRRERLRRDELEDLGRTLMEERLEAEGSRQLMIDAMNAAYAAINSDGEVTDWNESAVQIFGFTREEIIGRSAKEAYIPPEDHDEFDWLISRATGKVGEARPVELRLERRARRKDGTIFMVELAASTLTHDGEVSLHTFMHDITDRMADREELQAHAADVEALAEATRALARSTEPDDARYAICLAAAEVANAEIALLFEPDAAASGLRVTAAEGAVTSGELMPFDGEPSGAVRAFAADEQLFVPDLPGDVAVNQSMVHRTGAASALWVPVEHAGSAIGVIAVAWKQPRKALPERLRRVMSLVGAEAAVAIERAGLLERLARMATTDDLTSLPNRRAWDQEIEREIARARREGSELSIAMVDLDLFKDFNDRRGHQAGDRLLKEAAGTWKAALRESDFLARYGGEEFIVALPGCGADAAANLVERLRAATPSGESCSAGLVTWDRQESSDQLVGRADRALYAAKQAGRDRTVTG